MYLRPLVLLGLSLTITARADEGLWLYNQFPRAELKSKYGFEVTDRFLDKLQHASVRFNSGGSGSFVSANGLLFTNHHVGADCIQKLSSKDHDYLKKGFLAATPADEKSCPDLEVNVLLKIEDVTAKVGEKIPQDAAPAEVNRLRRANIAAIEKECGTATGNRCDVVTLYAGGMYNLYQYKKYTDIRLVFAPEFGIAFFGGDPDNFTFPRYDLDTCFFRAYENGQPVKPQHFLSWSKEGAKEGELTFVSGHPGTTSRLFTMAQLEFARDVSLPMTLYRLDTLMKALMAYGNKGDEQMRQRNDLFFGASNSLKANTGFLGGLKDPTLMDKKRQAEGKLKDAVMSDAAKRAKFGTVWDEIAKAIAEAREYYPKYYAWEVGASGGSELMYYARTLTRLAAESKKPNGERLKEFTDAARPSLEQSLFSTAPVYPGLETAVIAENLRYLVEKIGPDDAVVKQLLDGKSLEAAAEAAVKSSKLADPELRKQLAANADALAAVQDDGILRMARLMDVPAREYRKRYEDGLQAQLAVAAPKVAQARFDVYGAGEYPDATFTLRLTYGLAKGYVDAKGKKIPWATDFEGLYKRGTGKDPYIIPASWLAARKSLNLKTPYNFVATDDIHGGNSGSPTIDTKGEVIGIVFDGNLESLPNRYLYDAERARSVHVASQGIIESLRKVYKADRVLTELGF